MKLLKKNREAKCILCEAGKCFGKPLNLSTMDCKAQTVDLSTGFFFFKWKKAYVDGRAEPD